MAAQIDFHAWREPAQFVTITVAHEERRLREIVLRRDGLHLGVRKPRIQRADGGGIAGEDLLRRKHPPGTSGSSARS